MTDPRAHAATPPEVRPPADDAEVAAWFATEALGFGGPTSAEFISQESGLLPVERMLGVWVDGRCEATAGSYPFELTLPGGTTVAASGVCDISVAPDARRRGHLRALLARLHADARDEGAPVAVLTASDGAIYGRFGYGVAASELRWKLAAHHLRLRPPTTPPPDASWGEVAGLVGEVVLGDGRTRGDGAGGPRDVAEVLDELWERTRRQRAGTLSRTVDWWRAVLGPLEGWKGGGVVFTHLARDPAGDGTVRGAVVYRLHRSDDAGVQDWVAEPLEVLAETPAVESHLWTVVAGLDHVATVAPRSRPVDEPLRWSLVDPRRLRVVAHNDQLWLCPLDVAALLSARRYAATGDLVLAVEHPDPEAAGIYHLEVEGERGRFDDPAGARGNPVLVGYCKRERASPDAGGRGVDLRVGADALGALSLGGVSASVLARAGRVHEARPGALLWADAALAVPLAPFNSTFF